MYLMSTLLEYATRLRLNTFIMGDCLAVTNPLTWEMYTIVKGEYGLSTYTNTNRRTDFRHLESVKRSLRRIARG